jgi:hypothetical protein
MAIQNWVQVPALLAGPFRVTLWFERGLVQGPLSTLWAAVNLRFLTIRLREHLKTLAGSSRLGGYLDDGTLSGHDTTIVSLSRKRVKPRGRGFRGLKIENPSATRCVCLRGLGDLLHR